MRDQYAKTEQDRAQREQWSWVWGREGPPVWSNWALVIIAGVASWAAIVTLGRLREQVDAANRSADTAHNAFVADQRPWVALDVSIAGPLAYDAAGWDAGPRWHIPIRYQLRHVGKTPATHVAFFANIYPLYLPPRFDNRKLFDDLCSFPEKLDAMEMGFGQVLFPNEAREQLFRLNGSPALFEEAKTQSGYTGQFLVVACATYGSTLSKDRYRTAKAFHLWKHGGDIQLAGETIPPDRLRLTLSPLNGSYAK